MNLEKINNKWINKEELNKCEILTGWNSTSLYTTIDSVLNNIRESKKFPFKTHNPHSSLKNYKTDYYQKYTCPKIKISGIYFNIIFILRTLHKSTGVPVEKLAFQLITENPDKSLKLIEYCLCIRNNKKPTIYKEFRDKTEKRMELLKTTDFCYFVDVLDKKVELYPIKQMGYIISHIQYCFLNGNEVNYDQLNYSPIKFDIFIKVYKDNYVLKTNYKKDLLSISKEMAQQNELIIFQNKDNENIKRNISKNFLKIRIPKLYEKYKDKKIINEFNDSINESLIEYIINDSIDSINKHKDLKIIIEYFNNLIKIADQYEINMLKNLIESKLQIINYSNIIELFNLSEQDSWFFNKCINFCTENYVQIKESKILFDLSASLQARISLNILNNNMIKINDSKRSFDEISKSNDSNLEEVKKQRC